MTIDVHNSEINKILDNFFLEKSIDVLKDRFENRKYDVEIISQSTSIDAYSNNVSWDAVLEITKLKKLFRVHVGGRARPIELNSKWVGSNKFLLEYQRFEWVKKSKV